MNISKWLKDKKEMKESEEKQTRMNEDFFNRICVERALILQKKSILPASKRARVMEIYDALGPEREETKNE